MCDVILQLDFAVSQHEHNGCVQRYVKLLRGHRQGKKAARKCKEKERGSAYVLQCTMCLQNESKRGNQQTYDCTEVCSCSHLGKIITTQYLPRETRQLTAAQVGFSETLFSLQ